MGNPPKISFRNATIATALAVVFCLAGSAGQAQTTPETMKQAITQADGITNRVVDGLWEQTDKFWHEGDYNRIVALCRVCVEADPSFNDAYSNAAWLLWSMGDTPAADNILEYGLNRTKEKGDLYYELGFHLFNTKRYPAAEKYLRKSIALGGVPVTAYTTLAHSLRIQKKYDDSIAMWKTIIKKFPNWSAGQANLARVVALKNGTKS